MIRGTTPKHTFTSPIEMELVANLRIIYAQNGRVMFVKELPDCSIDGQAVSVQLTQEETLAMDASQAVEVQMRILATDGNALASKVKRVAVSELLEDEVIV